MPNTEGKLINGEEFIDIYQNSDSNSDYEDIEYSDHLYDRLNLERNSLNENISNDEGNGTSDLNNLQPDPSSVPDSDNGTISEDLDFQPAFMVSSIFVRLNNDLNLRSNRFEHVLMAYKC